MIPRRRTNVRGPVLATLALGLFPLVLTLWLTHDRQVSAAKGAIEQAAGDHLRAVERLLGAAEGLLPQLARETSGLAPKEAAEALQRAVYRSPYFREAGVVREGRLVSTSLGAVEPPRLLAAPPEGTSPGLRIVGVIKTEVMGTESLVLAWPTGPGSEVNLLVDPALLAGAVLGPSGLREGSTRVIGPGGMPLLTADAGAGATGSASSRLEATSRSSRFDVRCVESVSRSWALRHWVEDAMLLTPLSVLCIAALAGVVGEVSRRRRGMEEEIRVALARGEFEPHYQPTIELATGRCVGAEVLLRWKHPTAGYVRPDTFIGVAETSGLIEPITRFLMERVAAEMGPTIRRRPHLHLGVNLAPAQFADARLAERLCEIFREATIPPSNILLEATERAAMQGDGLAQAFESLRTAGFRVALDDFGTGYSSLSYLSRLRFDVLKIDASFVWRIGKDHVSAGVLDAIAHLGRTLQAEMIAEGIESQEQRAHLVSLGVPVGQGWLYSKALPAAEFLAYLERHA